MKRTFIRILKFLRKHNSYVYFDIQHIWNILEKWDQKYKKINKYFKNTYKYKKEEIHLEDAEKLRILFC